MTQLTYAAHMKAASRGSCKNAPSGAHFRAQLNVLNPNHGKGRAGINTPLLPHQAGEKGGFKEAVSRAGEPQQALRMASQLVPLKPSELGVIPRHIKHLT